MKASEVSTTIAKTSNGDSEAKKKKPPFRPAKDDTKPVLQDPIIRSDPTETEEAVLRLPPFPSLRSKSQS
ncbi:hypothetical protein Vadar_018509 [Vaccinium darrowii]|uniref:Uncharacterized protein n=1 Tax=Vaccinium darrowii TaxID=229202 RepID=A0ACB7YNZ2_9ERIC|nr:hypothetical protein Vadar_018509 [Vaccinium darrowii]